MSFPELTNPYVANQNLLDSGVLNKLRDAQTMQANIQNQYMPQQLQSENLSKQLANEMSKISLQYAPQMTQAELAYKQAQTPYLQAQTGAIPSEIALRQAQTGAIPSEIAQRNAQIEEIKQKSQYMPLEMAMKASESQRMNNRFGPAFELSRALSSMPQAERSVWMAQHPEEYNNLIGNLANATAQGGGAQGSINPEFINKYIPGAMHSVLGGGPAPTVPFSQATPQNIDQLKTAAAMSANKALTSAATQRQMEGAIQVGGVMNDSELQTRAQDASNYAGAVRKGGAALDALSQTNPAAYENYLAFKNQDMVLLQNRIKQLDGMGATDSQREELHGLYSKTMDSLTSNPAQFITQFNKLGESLDRVAKSVQKSASPVVPINRLEGFKPIGSSSGNKNYSQEDLEHTAQKYNMTVDQVKQKLGAQ